MLLSPGTPESLYADVTRRGIMTDSRATQMYLIIIYVAQRFANESSDAVIRWDGHGELTLMIVESR